LLLDKRENIFCDVIYERWGAILTSKKGKKIFGREGKVLWSINCTRIGPFAFTKYYLSRYET